MSLSINRVVKDSRSEKLDPVSKFTTDIESLLPQVMAADRLAARREIALLTRKSGEIGSGKKLAARIQSLEKRLRASAIRKTRRRENRPALNFNRELPIYARKDEIIGAIARHPVIVVSGDTGSGKTTQLPQLCLAAGRGIDGLIGCTQPRRIAATTVARRIAEELGQAPGKAVGYKIRFRDHTDRDAYIKMMTDGILLAETQGDPSLGAYDTIIVDEAHERSLNIDFILGILQTLVRTREDLKLIVTSATIDTQKFSKAFGDAPIIEVSGRMYPVELQYPPLAAVPDRNDDLTHVELACQAVRQVLRQSRSGDMLVFMPTEQDIRETCELIEAENPRHVRVMPLYARLTAAEQSRVFDRGSERKVIVATNVAETSITIPGIKYVIDSGLARISRYSPRTRTTSLPVVPISKSSCDQRKGRCGRVQNGICIRLYSEEDYDSRPQFTPPEVLRTNLAEVILRMISLHLGAISEFPFIDQPDSKSIQDGFDLLFELGAILKAEGGMRDAEVGRRNAEYARQVEKGRRGSAGDRGSEAAGHVSEGTPQSFARTEPGAGSGSTAQERIVLTEKGRLMARIPLDPRLSRMLIEAQKEGCIEEVAVLAAALSIQDPRERPLEKAAEADRVHTIFQDPQSDFVTLLNIWRRYHDHLEAVKSNNQMKRFCREHFLSFIRMREWRDIHHQVWEILREHGMGKGEGGRRKAEAGKRKAQGGNRDVETGGKKERMRENDLNSNFESIHKSILSGFLSNIAQKKDHNIYRASKGREVMIFPGSGLFNRGRNWIVAEEMMETSRLFARTVANIDSGWLEALGGDLCRRTYLDPHWEKNRGEVVAAEQVSLFGLIIVSERKVSFGKVNPSEAASIFIREALVNGDVKKPFAFMVHNKQLIDEVEDLENRFRRRDLLTDEHHIFEFYRERLPDIYDTRTLSRFLRKKDGDRFLRMKKEMLLQYRPDEKELASYPVRLDIDHQLFECSYRFDPGKAEDGVTVKVPSAVAPAVSAEGMEWLVPGLFPEKIEFLIKGLPKSYRKQLVPVKNTVDIIVREMPRTRTSLVTALGDFIFRRFGIDIPAATWPHESLPDHLKMRIAVTAPDGKELRSGRDVAILRQDAGEKPQSDEFEAARKKWEKEGLTRWDFGDLPDLIDDPAKQKTDWVAYPALGKDIPNGKCVHLRLFRRRAEALQTHRLGVATLYTLHFAKNLNFLKRQLVLPPNARIMADFFGGAKKLGQQMFDRVVQELFAKNIRTQKRFYTHADAVADRIFPTGQALREKTLAVLAAYHDARTRIYTHQQANRANTMAVSFFEELIRELDCLVPPTFVTIYDFQRLDHLPRYINAAAIRARRAVVDFEKDRSKHNEVARFTVGLNEMLKALSPSVSNEKREAIEAYYWMLEEYKVSVFAQELKTAIPISAKRLETKLGEIGRMI